MKSRLIDGSLSLFVFMVLGTAALLAPRSVSATSHSAAPVVQSMTEAADAEVRKVDKDAKKITLRHGELRQLDMPPMTMVFQVRDAALLDKVKAGDKVKFRARNDSGAFVVTEIEVIR